MTWRPVDWLNPHDTELDRLRGKHWGRARDYEDGADAVFEAREKWLAEQRKEPKPCEACEDSFTCDVDISPFCATFNLWQGRQEGYAEGQRNRESVLLNWLAHNGLGLTIQDLEAWHMCLAGLEAK